MGEPKYHLAEIFDPQRAHPGDAHSILMRLVPPDSHVLELGCASGYLSGYMEQALGCRVTALDADPVATAIAARRCSEVHTADLDAPGALGPARWRSPRCRISRTGHFAGGCCAGASIMPITA